MKKLMLLILMIGLLFAGCSSVKSQTKFGKQEPVAETVASQTTSVNTEQAEPATKIYPLPDTTMDDLSNATLAISLEEGDAYVDDTGKMQMDIKVYSYDKYDFVDISMLEVGDILVTHTGEVKLETIDRNDDGSISINGGLGNGGFDLISDIGGCFYV